MKTGRFYWTERGFLDFEASAYKNITTEAINDSPYIQQMIRDRIRRFLRAQSDGLTNRKYYFRIRKMYVDNGFANSTAELVLTTNRRKRDRARNKAFNLFTAYKDKYGIRDKSGKLIGTPRPKTKVVVKKGTSLDRAIRDAENEINRLKGRLSFPMSDSERQSLQTQLTNQQRRLSNLKTQFD